MPQISVAVEWYATRYAPSTQVTLYAAKRFRLEMACKADFEGSYNPLGIYEEEEFGRLYETVVASENLLWNENGEATAVVEGLIRSVLFAQSALDAAGIRARVAIFWSVPIAFPRE